MSTAKHKCFYILWFMSYDAVEAAKKCTGSTRLLIGEAKGFKVGGVNWWGQGLCPQKKFGIYFRICAFWCIWKATAPSKTWMNKAIVRGSDRIDSIVNTARTKPDIFITQRSLVILWCCFQFQNCVTPNVSNFLKLLFNRRTVKLNFQHS